MPQNPTLASILPAHDRALPDCEGCAGRGVAIYTSPDNDRYHLWKCDDCEVFGSDAQAAQHAATHGFGDPFVVVNPNPTLTAAGERRLCLPHLPATPGI